MTSPDFIKCARCGVPQHPDQYARTRGGGKRKTCTTCCGMSIALGIANRMAGGEPPSSAPVKVMFDRETSNALDAATRGWGQGERSDERE